MKDGEIAAPGLRFIERPDVMAQLVVYRQRENLGLVAHRPQEVADVPRAVADGVSLMGGGHPLVHSHQLFFSVTIPAVDPGCGGSAWKMAGRYCCSSNSSSLSLS